MRAITLLSFKSSARRKTYTSSTCHLTHLIYSSLLSLDVSCFTPLKRAYSREIESLVQHQINHITKLEFLLAIKAAYDRSSTLGNIQSTFRGAGLVPLHPDVVLSKLNVQLRTPTPPAALIDAAYWKARTLSNVYELEAQSTLIREHVR